MKMTNLTAELVQARAEHRAIPAFNIFNYISASAVVAAAEACKSTVILQTSTGIVKYYGARKLVNMIQAIKQTAGISVYLHLDHCASVDFCKECMDCGWDSIMYDGSKLLIEDNIRNSREVVLYAHARGITVEGELGTIVGVEEEVQVDQAELALLDDCLRYVSESGIDYFAPAVGTAHGVYKGEPHLNFDLVEDLGKRIDQPIVIHGGTGLSVSAFQEFIRRGAAKINISTALKNAYFKGCRDYLEKFPDKSSPLDLDHAMYESLRETALYHLGIFRL